MVNRELTQWYHDIFPANYSFSLQLDILWRVCSLLATSNGYAFVPKSFIQKDLDDHKLAVIPLRFSAPPPLFTYLVIKNRQCQIPKVQRFLEEFRCIPIL